MVFIILPCEKQWEHGGPERGPADPGQDAEQVGEDEEGGGVLHEGQAAAADRRREDEHQRGAEDGAEAEARDDLGHEGRGEHDENRGQRQQGVKVLGEQICLGDKVHTPLQTKKTTCYTDWM